MRDSNRENAAVFYVADGYDTQGRQLMGRRAAGEAFLRALALNQDGHPLICCAPGRSAFSDFQKRIADFGTDSRETRFVPVADRAALAEVGCLFYPGPDIAKLGWHRAAQNPRGHSLTGVTHTTASHGALDAILAMAAGGLEAWDALICTSRSVLSTVEQVLGTAHEQALARGERPRVPPVQLPVIPLGVDCSGLAPGPDAPAHRARFRRQFGIGDDDVAVLSLARTSYHGKAHPLPMYVALQTVANRPGAPKLHMLQTGWFANAALEEHFREAAKALCPDVSVHFVNGTDTDTRRHIWHAADIFSLMSDNIQETFGLAPVEAMAAGLPVVATDWDGFRDTVRDGVDGFMARTAMPGPGAGDDLALRHDLGVDSYDRYIGGASQTTAVSLADTIAGFAALATNPDLRRQMGASGLERARAVFDWPVVIAQYRALWAELAERRMATEPVDPLPPTPPLRVPHPVNPARDDPFRLFAGYPTMAIGIETPVRLHDGTNPDSLRQRAALAMNSFAGAVLPGVKALDAMLRRIGQPSSTAAEAIAAANLGEATGLRGIGWLAKMGLVQLADQHGKWL